jgi:hypothetical protein
MRINRVSLSASECAATVHPALQRTTQKAAETSNTQGTYFARPKEPFGRWNVEPIAWQHSHAGVGAERPITAKTSLVHRWFIVGLTLV